ncbi:MAG: ATP-binding protein [Bacteroidaceae bacterium]|nr:ATP-binding protein [Bacteroidaceae bacterium]
MTRQRFEPIADKCAEIVEFIMSSPDIPSSNDLEFKIRLCAEEAVENIVRYAYENGAGYLEVSIDTIDGDTLRIELIDSGKPFDPLAKPDPDITLSLEERQIGGLGIFLCKQMMDKLEYRYENGCNIFTMQKKTV